MPTKSVKLQSRGRRVFFPPVRSPTQKKSHRSTARKEPKNKQHSTTNYTEKRALLINLAFFVECRVGK